MIVKAPLPQPSPRIDGAGRRRRPPFEGPHETDQVFAFHQQVVGHDAPGRQRGLRIKRGFLQDFGDGIRKFRKKRKPWVPRIHADGDEDGFPPAILLFPDSVLRFFL
ncbi:MAG: hypothetical protein K9L59_17970 [Desulfobacterales bacterium]|nr:hypothetical protein [Desulfobacterales bacterium]